ncbi:hypothetical protein [Flavobacterium sp.]|uniref:hypothetical protein n=1 Tax=Flavobacterium sp. TaxID=239 RepID=UPI002CB36907|nr:hypothetical protein [Flavobacterium sp.]HSD06540.1 hypothetical protein [Flavobacterium sp.]
MITQKNNTATIFLLCMLIIGCSQNKGKDLTLSTKSYIDYEHSLVDILKKNGWIESYTENRQDSFIKWTKKGDEKIKNFIENVNAIQKIEGEKEKEFLYEFAYYQNILEKSENKEIESKINSFLGNDSFLLIIKNKQGEEKVYFFENKKDNKLIGIIQDALKNDNEIIFYETGLIKSNTPKLTPFGAKNY